MSIQSRIDEIERSGVYRYKNCESISSHSPRVICRNKQNELNELYRKLEQEQAAQRRLMEQEAAKAEAERLRLEKEAAAKLKAEEEAAKELEELDEMMSREKEMEEAREIALEEDKVAKYHEEL